MSAVLQQKVVEAANEQSSDESLLDKFSARQSRELVIAFAGPIGCGIASAINTAEESLKQLGYVDVVRIKLSEFLEGSLKLGHIAAKNFDENNSSKFLRYRRLQQAGMDLREATGNQAILAEYAIQSIVVDREKKNLIDGKQIPAEPTPRRVAYLIDQVKRPEEVELLRALYRNLFYLVGVTKSYEQRVQLLQDEGVKTLEVAELIEIDRNENSDAGQRLDKTLHLADYFIRNDTGANKRASIDRFFWLIHGDKSKTPTVVEQGMYAAYAAGLRSACLSRQVGASIATKSGEILATGCNDVPMAGGGLYHADAPGQDNRCVHRPEAHCFNDHHKQKLFSDITTQIEKALGANLEGEKASQISEERKKLLLELVYQKTGLKDLIEFSRSVHAEMDALISLARSGSMGVGGATLFTTTFPCHSCARHIVAAGISEVYYIEPYEKSLARELHSDAISFEFSSDDLPKGSRVRFLHFEGISPRQFHNVFRAVNRKNGKGKFIPIQPEVAEKTLPEYLDDYKTFEKKAVQHLQGNLDKLSAQKTA